MSLTSNFKDVLAKENIEALYDEPMCGYTSYKIGGNADCIVFPNGAAQIKKVIALCKAQNTAYTVIGAGSNLLVSDDGYRGVVIACTKNLRKLEVEDTQICVGAGVLLSRVAQTAADHALTGMEPISGIFGTVGGSVAMNAGAYGGEISAVLKSVCCYCPETDEVREIPVSACAFGYRESIFLERGYIVLEATFSLQKGDKTQIRAAMAEYAQRRNDKQPLEYPSCGSVFKRPEGHFAGALIEQAGLKGFSIGGAQVSEKHAGFIINTGGATAADVCAVIEHVRKVVHENSGIWLECEMKTLGF